METGGLPLQTMQSFCVKCRFSGKNNLKEVVLKVN